MADAAPIDAAIRDLDAAILRADKDLRDMEQRAKGACCAACFHGAAYTNPAEKQGRRLAWLTVLLGKRGAPGDEERRGSIQIGTWP